MLDWHLSPIKSLRNFFATSPLLKRHYDYETRFNNIQEQSAQHIDITMELGTTYNYWTFKRCSCISNWLKTEFLQLDLDYPMKSREDSVSISETMKLPCSMPQNSNTVLLQTKAFLYVTVNAPAAPISTLFFSHGQWLHVRGCTVYVYTKIALLTVNIFWIVQSQKRHPFVITWYTCFEDTLDLLLLHLSNRISCITWN